MRSAPLAGSAGVGEENGVSSRDVEVVDLHRDVGQNALDERVPAFASPVIPELDADQELGGGNRRDRDVVLVFQQMAESAPAPLGGYEDGRIED